MSDLTNEIKLPTPLIQLNSSLFLSKSVEVYLKADYLTHPLLSGNKYRKLKYNLIEARNRNFKKILSFGGAYSNHIYALAGVAKLTDFEVHVVVRGEELNENSNSTLKFAFDCGIKLHFVSRANYRNKSEIASGFGEDYFVVPEGGTNEQSLLGTSEVVDEIFAEVEADYIAAAMGTAGTVSGFMSNKLFRGTIIGIPVLKGEEGLKATVSKLVGNVNTELIVFPEYHFGGYAKVPNTLRQFINDFKNEFSIQLDEIYTSKLCFAVMDLIKKDFFQSGSKVVIYHSGGLREN